LCEGVKHSSKEALHGFFFGKMEKYNFVIWTEFVHINFISQITNETIVDNTSRGFIVNNFFDDFTYNWWIYLKSRINRRFYFTSKGSIGLGNISQG